MDGILEAVYRYGTKENLDPSVVKVDELKIVCITT